MLVKSQVKYIQSLGQKKSRDESGVFIAEGLKLAEEILAFHPGQVQEVFALSSWVETQQKLPEKIRVTIIEPHELEKISHLSTPNQVLLIVKQFDGHQAPVATGKLTLALDHIQDPGNLGTIIRIADWFGVSQIVCSTDCADRYNSKVVQATMGSIMRVPVYYTDLEKWLGEQQNVRSYAAALEGQPVAAIGTIREGIIVIGNESRGISDDIMALVNRRITIPRKGKAESLNAAVAAGIILGYVS